MIQGQVMNESLKRSYIKCVEAVARELNELIITRASSNLEFLVKHAKNNDTSFKDAEKTVTKILGIFEVLEGDLHSTRSSFIKSWHFWLRNSSAAAVLEEPASGINDESIIVLGDENDLQIVNEVTYLRKKRDANDNLQTFDLDIQVVEDNQVVSIKDDSGDEKLNSKCIVRLEKCDYTASSQVALDEAFLRLIDLSALEKKSAGKRTWSTSSGSSLSIRKKLTKKRAKREQQSSDSDISSYYESSDTDDHSDEEVFDYIHAQELDNVEERAKLCMLQDSDTLSECSWPEDDSSCETLRQRKSSKIKVAGKKHAVRAAWLDDELLNFKLPNEPTTTDLDSTSCSDEQADSKNKGQDKESSKVEVKSAVLTRGRRNIRKVLDDQETTENTRRAVKSEESRLERLRDKNVIQLTDSSCVRDLILDVDCETGRRLVAVDSGLAKLLKPHQTEGVRFMWNCCFESVEQVKRGEKGSGCILAHCMGLGKTLQVITLAHTLLAHQVGIKTLMIVCPKSTILNWIDEFDLWLEQAHCHKNLNIVELTQSDKDRSQRLENWQQKGGVLIISYEMFRSLTSSKRQRPLLIEKQRKLLIDPGPDWVVCDEGHLLKNEKSKLASRMQQLKTQRRIILTGTPLQNNLDEYYCMIQFVKPNLLGTKQEFLNRFGNPITNGQFNDSTPYDVNLMKKRAHVLHKMLEGCVQRRDYAVLMPFLPPKHEYVIKVCLSDVQTHLYQTYISDKASNCGLLKNYQEIKRLVAHPKAMQLKAAREIQNAREEKKVKQDCWWRELVKEEDLDNVSASNKLLVLFGLLDACAKERDKVLVFSQCLFTLEMIEVFLRKMGDWLRGRDYFRLDGTVSPKDRRAMCRAFNDPAEARLRLMLISTKAGGLGINLTAANRVVIFDPSWNPSIDLQSIFRVFRFGQTKPCYVYRLLTAGTMEEKIYNRQVTKLSLSLRVVDEQQVGRHYRDSDLQELYTLESLPDGRSSSLAHAIPSDPALAAVLLDKHVYKYFEHDSLLENQEDEELDKQEREQAWREYQLEKHAPPGDNLRKTTTERVDQEDN